MKKAECRRADAFELCWRRLLSHLDCKEIKLVNPKENRFWIFIGRTDVEAEAPILWPPDEKSQLIGKDPGENWGQEEKQAAEDKMIRWCHWINGHEFEQTLGDREGQGSCMLPAAVHGVTRSRTWFKRLNNKQYSINTVKITRSQTKIMKIKQYFYYQK